jgi:hypothetical protein
MAGTPVSGRGEEVKRGKGEKGRGKQDLYRSIRVLVYRGSTRNPKPETRNLLIPPLDLRDSME